MRVLRLNFYAGDPSARQWCGFRAARHPDRAEASGIFAHHFTVVTDQRFHDGVFECGQLDHFIINRKFAAREVHRTAAERKPVTPARCCGAAAPAYAQRLLQYGRVWSRSHPRQRSGLQPCPASLRGQSAPVPAGNVMATPAADKGQSVFIRQP